MNDQPNDDQQGGDVPQMPQIPLGPDGLPDFSKIDPSMLPPMPAVDKALAERVITLYRDIDVALKGMNLDPEDRKSIEKNLMEAIAADLLTRLGEKMSDDDKDELTGMAQDSNGQPDLNEVAGFFKERFEQKDLVQALAEATETVLSEFAESVKNRDEAGQ
jgi:hypothetical protein